MDQLITVTRGDDIFLGIGTGISPKTLRARTLVTLPRSSGVLITVDGATRWPITGITEHNEEIYLLGPHIDGVTLGEALESPENSYLSVLSRLARAVDLLEKRTDLRPRLHPRTVIMERDGGVLFLPDAFEHLVAESTDDSVFGDDEFLDRLPWHVRVSLRFAIMAYIGLTDTSPDWDEPELLLSRALGAGIVRHPILMRPDLREDVANDVAYSLSTSESRARSAGEWEDLFRQWLQRGTHTDERTAISEGTLVSYERSHRKAGHRYRRRRFVRERWKQLVAVALIGVLAVTVPGTIAMRTLAPPKTKGLPPLEVVYAHFAALNRLDTDYLRDTVRSGTDKERLRLVDNIFVFTRVRHAIEGRSPVLSPEVWESSGRSVLAPGQLVFGAAGLGVSPLRGIEGRRAVEVSYEFWQPAVADDGENQMGAPSEFHGIVYQHRDLLFLEQSRDVWQITERRVLSRTGRRIRIPYGGGQSD